ncbi:MAG: hypothetical protein O2794_03995 [bacterium]|nr:hypothetical protein [bacterium]
MNESDSRGKKFLKYFGYVVGYLIGLAILIPVFLGIASVAHRTLFYDKVGYAIAPFDNIFVGTIIVLGVVLYSYLVWKHNRNKWVMGAVLVAVIFGYTIILSGLNNSRPQHGPDRVVRGTMSAMRVQGELYFDEHGSYGSAPFSVGPCPTESKNFVNVLSSFEDSIEYIKNVPEREVYCAVSLTPPSWAVSSNFVGDYKKDKFWCVDSTGASKEVSLHITEAQCPEE